MSSKKKVKAPPMRGVSPVRKRSIVIAGHKTSLSLEDAFWNWLKAIAHRHNQTLSTTVALIDTKGHANLSSAIRLYVLNYTAGPAPTRETAAS